MYFILKKISTFLKGRSGVKVKNRFYSKLKKYIHKDFYFVH